MGVDVLCARSVWVWIARSVENDHIKFLPSFF